MTDDKAEYLLDNLNKNVELIQKKTSSRFSSLFNGMLTGFGSVVGAALAIAIIGWFLNMIGIIPAFKNEAQKWQQLLKTTQEIKTQSTQTR